MKITNCYWEKRNLNCDVVEITIDSHDIFNKSDFAFLEDYKYIVIKVPTNMIDYNFGLSQLGYTMIELQMEMNLKIKEFNIDNKLIKAIGSRLDFQDINTEKDLDDILTSISNDMFTTDRIVVDSHFGEEMGRVRYLNWIKDEFQNKTSKIIKLIYNGEHVGFSMFRDGDTLRGLLGGVYSKFQKLGIGSITPIHLPIYVHRNRMNVKRIVGDISSNNRPVWELYDYFGYKACNPRYVFVKHNK